MISPYVAAEARKLRLVHSEDYDEARRLERWVHDASQRVYEPIPEPPPKDWWDNQPAYEDALLALGWASRRKPRLVSPTGWLVIAVVAGWGAFFGLVWGLVR